MRAIICNLQESSKINKDRVSFFNFMSYFMVEKFLDLELNSFKISKY